MQRAPCYDATRVHWSVTRTMTGHTVWRHPDSDTVVGQAPRLTDARWIAPLSCQVYPYLTNHEVVTSTILYRVDFDAVRLMKQHSVQSDFRHDLPHVYACPQMSVSVKSGLGRQAKYGNFAMTLLNLRCNCCFKNNGRTVRLLASAERQPSRYRRHSCWQWRT